MAWRRPVRISAWLLVLAIVVLSVVPPSLRPQSGAPSGWEHAGIFFLTGVAFAVAYPSAPARKTIALIAFCGVVEIIQLWAPGRHFRWSDFAVDALTICLGYWFVQLIAVSKRQADAVRNGR